MADEATPQVPVDETPAPEVQTPEAPSAPTNQAALNAAAAKNRRGLQKELAEAKKKAQQFDKLQQSIQANFDGEGSAEEKLEAMADAIFEAKTKEEQSSERLGKLEGLLNKQTELAKANQDKYNSAMVERAILDASADLVVQDNGREGAVEYFQLKLSQLAEVQENGDVLVKWNVTDENGTTEAKMVPVKQALESMEADPSKYGRYFRSTVNGGAGGETVDGIGRTPDGNLDFANMDFAKFQELSQKNPGALLDAANKLEF
jgi:hypothetical protein